LQFHKGCGAVAVTGWALSFGLRQPVREGTVILLYEPDAELAPLFRFLLEHLGCTVHVVATLDAATQVASEHAQALAVVHPEAGVDGWQRCLRVKNVIGGPVIGLLLPDAAHEPAADVHVLPLPVDPNALRDLVTRLLAIALF
jgi:CheY-like chemotaxis protein